MLKEASTAGGVGYANTKQAHETAEREIRKLPVRKPVRKRSAK